MRINKRVKKYISIGAWISDTPKDMPQITIPEDLPQKVPLSNSQISHYITYEGLGFCIYSYIPVKKIEDPHLKDLWIRARDAMQKVLEYLYKEESNA